MALTSPFCPADRLQRRGDLVVRPLPEIRMCMVYRPRPARIVTLNPTSWLMLEACTGATAAEIEAVLGEALSARNRAMAAGEIQRGLGELVALSLVRVDSAREDDRNVNNKEP